MPVVEDGFLVSTNPATGAEAGRVPISDEQAVTAAVQDARAAGAWWAALGFDGRKVRLLRWRALLAERIEELAALTHAETGKPVTDAVIEAVTAIEHIDWAARNAKRVLGPRRTRTRLLVAEHAGHLEYQPYGVVGVIGPWNYPILTPLGPISGALAAGNAVVLKPSEYTPTVGQWLVDTFAEIVPEQPVLRAVLLVVSEEDADHLFVDRGRGSRRHWAHQVLAILVGVELLLPAQDHVLEERS